MRFSGGYLTHAEPYFASDTNIAENRLGQGPDVVLVLIDKCKLPKQSIALFDNLFTTLPLLNKLSEDSISGLGTIRENTLQGGPLMKKSDLQKKKSQVYDQASDEKNIVIAWRDNKAMIVATNYLSCEPISSVKRWSKSEKSTLMSLCESPSKFTMKVCVESIFLTNSLQIIDCSLDLGNGGGLFLHGLSMRQR